MLVAREITQLWQLLERTEAFDEAAVEKLRKDFLLLMKNVDKVKDYAMAEELRQYVKTWREYLNTLVREKYIPQVQAVSGDMWAKGLGSKHWSLHLALSEFPMNPIGYERLHRPDISEEFVFAKFAEKRADWAAKTKRAAAALWKTFKEYFEGAYKVTKTIEVPEEPTATIEGFTVKLVGRDKGPEYREQSLEFLRDVLKLYRRRAARVFPLLLKRQLLIRYKLDCGLNGGGLYYSTENPPTIEVCAPWKSGSAEETSHILAHEMGHHVWKTYLSDADKRFWTAAIQADYGVLDIRILHDLMKAEKLTRVYLAASEKLRHENPVLYLQIGMLGNEEEGFRVQRIRTLEDVEAVIATGVVSVPLPKNPITIYAAKNDEEAFCEALGMLIGYGPQAVPEIVRGWLKTILPSLHVESATPLRGWVAELQELLA
jgi:hypothetical protein